MFKKTLTPIKLGNSKYILICMVVMFVLNCAIYTLYSLRSNFSKLDNQARNSLTILLDSISKSKTMGADIFDKQKKHILGNNQAYKTIDIYNFSDVLDVKKRAHLSLFHLFIEDEYYITNNFYTVNIPANSSLFFAEEEKLSGYVKLTIDLRQFRLNLIKNSMLFYLIFAVFYVFFTFLLIRNFNKLYKPAERLRKQSKIILNSTESIVLHNDNSSTIVDNEYKVIQSAIYSLITRHNTLYAEMIVKDERIAEYAQKKALIAKQRSGFQALITSELKTSLNSMTGGLKLLSQQYLSQEQQDALVILRKSNDQLNFVLEQIAQLNKIENNESSKNFVIFNPIQAISSLISLFEGKAIKKDITLISKISHIDSMLEGDIEKIRKILDALLDNAIKYTETGNVVVESSLQHFDETTRWVIKVVDTGIGIESDYFDHIFTPFFQIDNEINSDNKGIGVGLSIAKQLADLIDADLRVMNNEDTGTSFELCLTLFDKKQSITRSALQDVNICCFNELCHNYFSQGLEKFGANTSNVHDYKGLIHEVTTLNYEVLLIDTNLDINKIFDLAGKVRSSETSHRVLIIWLLNAENIIYENQAYAAGVDVLLSSDVEIGDLAETISEWLT